MSTVVETTHSAHGGEHTHVRISWAAIVAGVILVIAMQLLLSMLGLGIGLGLVSPNTSGTPDASSFGIGAGLWWLVSSLAAVAIGGYVASWLGGLTNRFDGVLHGLVTWGIATLLTFYLLTSAVGGLIGGAFSVVGSGLSAAGPASRRWRLRSRRRPGLRPTRCSSRRKPTRSRPIPIPRP